MTQLVKKSAVDIPDYLFEFFGNPPLIGEETLEEYINLVSLLGADIDPDHVVDWIYVIEAVDHIWQIRREKYVRAGIIAHFQLEIVKELLKAGFDSADALQVDVYRIFDAAADAQRWASDPVARKEINAKLATKGHLPGAILAQAHMRAARHIEPIEKRIASCEMRRMAHLREVERRNEKLAENLRVTTSRAIDGEFSEAAE